MPFIPVNLFTWSLIYYLINSISLVKGLQINVLLELKQINNKLIKLYLVLIYYSLIFRLASVQDQRPPVATQIHIGEPPGTVERKQILSNIQNMVPNHDARIQSLEVSHIPLVIDYNSYNLI